MVLNVSHYGLNHSQRLGKENASYEDLKQVRTNAYAEDRFQRTQASEENELVHLHPTFWNNRSGQAVMGAGILGGLAGISSLLQKNKEFGIALTIGAGLLGGLVGYCFSKGALKEAKYDYEMKNDVDLIPIKGSNAYKPVYNDHKTEKKLDTLMWLTLLN